MFDLVRLLRVIYRARNTIRLARLGRDYFGGAAPKPSARRARRLSYVFRGSEKRILPRRLNLTQRPILYARGKPRINDTRTVSARDVARSKTSV